MDIASAVAFVAATYLSGGSALLSTITALQMRKKKIKTTEQYDEEAVNNTLSANNISFNSNKDIEMKNTDIFGNIESSEILNNITVEGKHEYNETVSRSGGKWWKAAIAGLTIGLTSRLLTYFKVANKIDALSFDLFGDVGSFTSEELNGIKAIASALNTVIISTSCLGLAFENLAPNIIEATIISPTLGKYND